MVEAAYISYPLHFKQPSGTSRGVLNEKPCWFIKLTGQDGVTGMGEVSFIPGLSVEDPDEIEIQLDHVCKLISKGEMDPLQKLPSLPGIQFALESAMLDLKQGGNRILYPSDFTGGISGILTNGLIWMGERTYLLEQVRSKMEAGFRVLKLKVGALDFNEELEVLQWIRSEYGTGDLEIRLDANGAWNPENVREKLESLSSFGIHSIEQPIGAGQTDAMAELCREPAIPVALDEELIGITFSEEQQQMMEQIRPDYIILKPGLLGGFSATKQWIDVANRVGAGWWITSALESSIGLNAIAQWTYQLGVTMPQGLGTGMIYSNNIPSPLQMVEDRLWHMPGRAWNLQSIIDM
ncbi:MAG: o-succinylbenzoate synthase [Bacteroidota bacterium]